MCVGGKGGGRVTRRLVQWRKVILEALLFVMDAAQQSSTPVKNFQRKLVNGDLREIALAENLV